MRARLAALLMLVLTACPSSPMVHFYALSATSGESGGARLSYPVRVAAVHLPPSLDRRQMVRLVGPNRVDISDTDRWSASLDEMVRNVLTEDLAARLPESTVVLPGAPAPAGTAGLVVTIARFGPDADGTVMLTGSWSLLAGGSDVPAIRRDVRIEAGTAATADATAAAMSRALGRLASEIAAGLPERAP